MPIQKTFKELTKIERQQSITRDAKKDSKRYLMFGPNLILVTLEVGLRTFSLSRNVCRWFVTGKNHSWVVTTKKSCVSWKMFKMKFKFSKLVKSIVFMCLRANKTFGYSECSIINASEEGECRKVMQNMVCSFCPVIT